MSTAAPVLPQERGAPLRRPYRFALAALTLAPIAGGFAFVAAYGVNAPFVDMWNFIADLVHERSGHYSWTEIFKQHNEHRLVFPRLVLFALAGPFRLDDVPYMYVTEIALLLAAAVILWGVSRTFPSRVAVLLLGPPVAFLAFSYRQRGNMLLGFNMGFSFVEAFGVLALVLLYVAHESRPRRSAAVAVAALLPALIASGSGIQGLLVWPAGIVLLLLLRPVSRGRLEVWTAFGAAVWVAYFWHYRQPLNTRSPFYPLHHPVEGLRFFATLVGGSLAWSSGQALVIGAVLLGAGVVALVSACRIRPSGAQLWVAVLVDAVLVCASIASGRSFAGTDTALSSRYSTYSLLYVSALLVLVARLVWGRRTRIGLAAVAALVGLIAWGAQDSYRLGMSTAASTAFGRRLGAFYVATYRTEPDALLAGVYPDPRVIRTFAPALERLHYSVFDGRGPLPPLLDHLARDPGPSACTVDDVRGMRPGPHRLVTLPAGTTSIGSSGWCIDPVAHSTAGGVYFVIDGRAYPAFYGVSRTDVAALLRRGAYVHTGYTSWVVTGRLAPGLHTFSVIAVSHDRRRAFAPTKPVRIEIS